ncbi:MAG: glutaminyl-peptide cyclotransferase [Gemmatimonadaceae bacterium]|nr:glutaminyl-peptide cyclotransferase [Gemmatimonadaceae bacterium]
MALVRNPVAKVERLPGYDVEVVASYPHDTAAFTEGLVWYKQRLFEGTGEVGHSDIREVALQTGRVLRKRALPSPHFGEGIAILADQLYELTWRSGRAFQFDVRTFRPVREFAYTGEGWGLTTDGSSLIMSDGSSTIRFLDPSTFAVRRTIQVVDQTLPVSQLNELEWIKNEIWANVWQTDQIVRIDPASGKVVGWIHLNGLLSEAERSRSDVLNGIAYDSEQDRIFVTGKNWPRLFQIRLRER